jgi:branched-chain amino acid transport system permease protein
VTTAALLGVQVVNGLAVGALYALMAFGLSIIKGLLNVPNFSHGALFLVGAYVAWSVAGASGSFWLGLLAATAATALLGVVIERLLVRRLQGGAYLFQLLLLFGTALVMEQTVIAVWGGLGRSMAPPAWLAGAVDLGFSPFPRYLLFIVVAAGLVIAAVWALIERSWIGARIRAGIERPEMAQSLGINVEALFTAAFALGAGLAGLAGALAAPLTGLSVTMGTDMLAIALVVVVLGGLGSIYGGVLAGLLVGVVQSLAALWVPQASTVVIYGAMILVLAVRPQGLLGER